MRGPVLSQTIFHSPLTLELLDLTFYNVLRREWVSASMGVFERLIEMLPVESPQEADGNCWCLQASGVDRLNGGAIDQRLTRNEPLTFTHTDTHTHLLPLLCEHALHLWSGLHVFVTNQRTLTLKAVPSSMMVGSWERQMSTARSQACL